MLGASFFAVVHVGSAKRQVRGMEYGFGTRKAPEPPPDQGLASDFKRGAGVLVDKAGGFVDDVFSWGDDKPSAPLTASAKDAGAEDYGGDTGEKDPFEDFYNKNYGKGSGSSGSSGSSWGGGGSWGGFGGSSGGSSSSGGFGGDAVPAGGAAQEKAAAKEGAGEEADAGRAPRAGRPSVEDESGEWVKFKGRKGGKRGADGVKLASLPSGGPGGGAGDSAAGAFDAGLKPGKGGSLSGMPGQKGAAVDLNGPDEKASAGAKGDYGAAMSANASAVASGAAGGAAGGAGGGAGGGSVPAASGPKEVAAGDKDAKDGEKKDGEKKEGTAKEYSDSDYPDAYFPPVKPAKKLTAAADPDFLKIIAGERLKGKEADFIPEGAEKRMPEERNLRAGAALAPQKEKRALAAGEEEPAEKPDPEKFSALSSARKKELKSEVHVFLKSIENKYGAMTDIFFTACSKDKDTCVTHGLTEGYITMHTADARVQVGLKYEEQRWVPYTVSFSASIKLPKADPVEEEPAEDQTEDPPAEDNTGELMIV